MALRTAATALLTAWDAPRRAGLEDAVTALRELLAGKPDRAPCVPRDPATPRKPREGTKKEAVLTMLCREDGATIAQILVRDHYDDGGVSGGSLERPALRRMLADIERGLIDVIICYWIDRLSRSSVDFTKLVEVFDANNVTFVSVAQSFNTTTSMGRLTLNTLLSFAQFEREVIGERIRDKVAASRKRGIWTGGYTPHGYDVREQKLVVNNTEAALVPRIFQGFVEMESCTRLVTMLRADGATTKRGSPITKSDVYRILSNRVHLGDAVHKGTAYPGEHDAIVTQAQWDAVQAVLQVSTRVRVN